MDGILHRCLELSGESKVKETQQSFHGKFQDLKYSTTGANPGRLRKKSQSFLWSFQKYLLNENTVSEKGKTIL